MNNVKVLKFISSCAFVVSALFTIQLMTSGVSGVGAYILTVMMAIILETCKCGFFYEAITNQKLNIYIRSVLGFIAVLLVGSSIFASAAYIQNQANKVKNNQIKHSEQYKNQQEAKKLLQDLYNQKQAEIEALKKQAESLPKNYITVKQQTLDKASEKAKELEAIAIKIQEAPIEVKEVVSSNGYTSMFKILADNLNKASETENPISADELEMYFFISLGIIFELTAILTAYLAQHKSQVKTVETLTQTSFNDDLKKEKPEETPTKTLNKKIINISSRLRPKETVKVEEIKTPETLTQTSFHDDFKVKNMIGFRPEKQSKEIEGGIEKEDLRRYIEYMYEYAKDNVSPGYKNIAENIKLELETSRKIKGFLERKEILEVVGNKTIILKEKNDCLKSLGAS